MFHVISRFHDRRFYLDIEGAREKYLELLGKRMESHDARIVGYCLMSSHVHLHLVMQIGNDSIGSLTKKVPHDRGHETTRTDRPSICVEEKPSEMIMGNFETLKDHPIEKP